MVRDTNTYAVQDAGKAYAVIRMPAACLYTAAKKNEDTKGTFVLKMYTVNTDIHSQYDMIPTLALSKSGVWVKAIQPTLSLLYASPPFL